MTRTRSLATEKVTSLRLLMGMQSFLCDAIAKAQIYSDKKRPNAMKREKKAEVV